MNGKRTRVNVQGLQDMRARLAGAIESAVMYTAIAVRDEAKTIAPKDTTSLAESIYISTEDYSDHDEAIAKAKDVFDQAKAVGKTPKGFRLGPNSVLYTFNEDPRPEGKMTAWVLCGVGHGVAVEYGSGRHGPQPFLGPAVATCAGLFTSQIRTAINGLAVKAVKSTYSVR